MPHAHKDAVPTQETVLFTQVSALKNLLVTGVIPLLLCLSLFPSCGLNDDAPQDAEVYDLGNLEGSCELDTTKLKVILVENIDEDIDCLEVNLNQFVDFVRRSDDDLVDREELERFILKFFPESSEIAGDLLKLVFNLNTLILRDPPDKIRVEKLPVFFDIVRAVNANGRYLYTTLKDLTAETYWEKRQSLFTYTESLAHEIISIITPYIGEESTNYEIEIITFLEQLKASLKLSDDAINTETIESWLFAKKLLFGGKPTTATSDQIVDVLDRASHLLMLGLDTLYVGEREFQDKNNQYFFYLDIIRDLKDNLQPFQSNDIVMTGDDLFFIIDSFLSEESNIKDIELPITKFKEKFIGGNINEILFRDIDKLIGWLDEFAGMLYFNAITYDIYQNEMSAPDPIDTIRFPKLNAYSIFDSQALEKYWDQFSYISQNYRFYQDDDGKSHLYNYYKRFKSGFQTSSMIRWAIGKLIDVYGYYPVGKSEKEIDKKDLSTLLYDMQGLIEVLGFWPNDPDRFIGEAVMSSDLFMFHADGSNTNSKEELTEYANNVLHALGITEDVLSHLKVYCDIVDEELESIEVPCFREHFLHVFFNELKYEKYYSKLYDYLQAYGVSELQTYLINVELYGRINNDPKVPLTKEDLGRVLVILTNLETAFIRFDVNKDSILQRSELNLAFSVFKNLIIEVAGLGSEDSALYKSIFLYLIKHMEIPSATKLMWFHLFGKKKDITSKRLNISAILKNFVVE